MLGAADEAWQYFYLAPQNTNYFDFNDIILNILGAAIALVFISSLGIIAIQSSRKWYFSPILRVSVLLATGLFILIKTSTMHIYPPPDGIEAPILLVKKELTEFWSYIKHLNVKYHIVTPVEGIIATALLFGFYFTLDMIKTKKT